MTYDAELMWIVVPEGEASRLKRNEEISTGRLLSKRQGTLHLGAAIVDITIRKLEKKTNPRIHHVEGVFLRWACICLSFDPHHGTV